MKSILTLSWAMTLLLFIGLVLIGKFEILSCILPLFFITLSFVVVDAHPPNYRIPHLIINVQILIYYLLQLSFNHKIFLLNKTQTSFGFSPMQYMQADALLMPGYAYTLFIMLYFLAYLPYYLFKLRKAKACETTST